MLIVQMPALIATLPIVILIETLRCAKLAPAPVGVSFKAALMANLVSTLVGFPVLWVGLVALEMGVGVLANVLGKSAQGMGSGIPAGLGWIFGMTFGSAWLMPFEDKLYWMIPTAMVVLLGPSFFASVWVEKWFYRKILNQAGVAGDMGKLSWRVNAWSYLFLFIVGLGCLAYALVTGQVLAAKLVAF
jgi:hypothetical protein